MYKRSLILVSLVALSFLVNFSTSQVVCSQDELIKELYEDLIDNGIFLFNFQVNWIALESLSLLMK